MYCLKDIFDFGTDNAEMSVKGISADSRKTEKGELYVCLKDKKGGGEAYIKEAVARGAAAVICDETLFDTVEKVPCFSVKDPRSAYAKILSKALGEPSKRMKMIAVTGTNGKTTVTKMIESILKAAGKRVAVIGTLGAQLDGRVTPLGTMTTPDPEILYPLLKSYADEGAQYVIMEASSHALALSKLDGITFDIAAITNMTAEHLDFHGNMDGYFTAKSRLFERCKSGVFLCDDYYTVEMYKKATCRKVSCSVKRSDTDYYAENVGFSFENGTILSVNKNGSAYPLHSDITAEFTASNALLAFAVASELGIRPDIIYKGIAMLKNVEGRMQKIETDADFSVFIDFAHTPDAFSKLLGSIRQLRKRNERIVTLFGCGGDRDKSKRSLMGAIASRLSDMVIITSDNSRSEEPCDIIDGIMQGVDKSRPHVRIEDRKKAIEYAVRNAEKGDIILLLGKGHEKYEIGKNGSRYFSEEDIVKEALAERRKER